MTRLKEYGKKYGIKRVVNDFGERRYTRERSIVFPNGWVASIVKVYGQTIFHPDSSKELKKVSSKKWSVAICDYNGFFDWEILNEYGGIGGCIFCDTEEEILAACEIIRNLEDHFAESVFSFL